MDICAVADADSLFSVEELSAHTREELYGGGTSDKTISSLQVLFLFYFATMIVKNLVPGQEKHCIKYNRPEITSEGAKCYDAEKINHL